jgi:hypothetical protein
MNNIIKLNLKKLRLIFSELRINMLKTKLR